MKLIKNDQKGGGREKGKNWQEKKSQNVTIVRTLKLIPMKYKSNETVMFYANNILLLRNSYYNDVITDSF